MTDPYVEIAHHLPNEVRVGGALITLVEPHEGFESSYNRWYEDDHFYSGAMAGPWVFSGRRFVATRDLRSPRPSLTSPLADPPDSGCYISLYWITKGQEEAAERWGFHAMADSLAPRGRGFVERTHTYTAFHRFQDAFFRDQGPLRAETCLAHPFAGLYTEVIDTGSVAEFADLTRWCRGRDARRKRRRGLPGFRPRPLQPGPHPGRRGLDRRRSCGDRAPRLPLVVPRSRPPRGLRPQPRGTARSVGRQRNGRAAPFRRLHPHRARNGYVRLRASLTSRPLPRRGAPCP
jgi:hypothetical protein